MDRSVELLLQARNEVLRAAEERPKVRRLQILLLTPSPEARYAVERHPSANLLLGKKKVAARRLHRDQRRADQEEEVVKILHRARDTSAWRAAQAQHHEHHTASVVALQRYHLQSEPRTTPPTAAVHKKARQCSAAQRPSHPVQPLPSLQTRFDARPTFADHRLHDTPLRKRVLAQYSNGDS
jgi:hypothetical protein